MLGYWLQQLKPKRLPELSDQTALFHTSYTKNEKYWARWAAGSDSFTSLVM